MNADPGLAAPPARSKPDGWIASLIVLTAIYTMSFVDRQVLSLLLQPIKADLGLTDTQLSLLQGLAFTVTYVTFGPLFGRLADQYNRRNIVVAGLLAWTLVSAGCGMASSYEGLFAGRLMLGATQACLTPAVWSMLSDMFDERRLPRALSIFLMGPYLGGGLALIFGGMLLETAGVFAGILPLAGLSAWQITFLLISSPGIVLAAALLLVPEPARKRAQTGDKASMGEVGRVMWRLRRFYAPFFLGMASLNCVLYTMPAWFPTVLIRHFGGSPGLVGSRYGWGVLITGSLGVLLGPVIVRKAQPWRGKGDELLLIATIAAAVLGLLGIALMAASTMTAALAIAIIMGLFYTVPQALAASALTLATPPRMRGLVTALYILIVTVVGYGLAPVAVAAMAEAVMGPVNPLGHSLALMSIVTAFAATLLLRYAGRGYLRVRAAEFESVA